MKLKVTFAFHLRNYKVKYDITIGTMNQTVTKPLETLKINPTLTTLDLNRKSIGANGAQALAEALKTNST
ncbi:hypothetical protein BG005_004742, partial [Podila minutissima]